MDRPFVSVEFDPDMIEMPVSILFLVVVVGFVVVCVRRKRCW